MEATTAKMKSAYETGKAKVFHAISKNKILQVRIGEDGKLILEKTIRSIQLPAKKLKAAREEAQKKLTDVKDRAQGEWRRIVTGDTNKRIRDHMNEAPQVKMVDKLSFTMGVSVIAFTEYVIMRHPTWFTYFYVTFMLALCMIRFYLYKQQKYHLFMLDFCYIVNFSCMVQTLFFRDNDEWFNANYVCSMGPLCIAIILWHNSLVFHSLDKLTSFFLHAFPPILCHLYRWRLIPTEGIQLDAEASKSTMELYVTAFGIYLVWQIFFIFCTEVLLKSELDADPDLITSVRYLSRDYKNPMNRLVNFTCRKLGLIGKEEYMDPEDLRAKAVFVVAQCLYTCITLLPGVFVYRSYHCSFGYLVIVFLIGTWNGGSYYIEVFSKRYNMKFQDKKPSIPRKATDPVDVPDAALSDNESGDEEFIEALEEHDLDADQTLELYKLLQSVDSVSGDLDALNEDCDESVNEDGDIRDAGTRSTSLSAGSS